VGVAAIRRQVRSLTASTSAPSAPFTMTGWPRATSIAPRWFVVCVGDAVAVAATNSVATTAAASVRIRFLIW